MHLWYDLHATNDLLRLWNDLQATNGTGSTML
jgi:hypothetical protein